MKRLLVAFLLLSGALAGCKSEIDAPDEITLQARKAVDVLPADAAFVGRLDARAVQQNEALNPFGTAGAWTDGLGTELSARLKDFIDATGFDPSKDVREIYVAHTPDAEGPSLVVYADYDRARMEAYIAGPLSDEVTVGAYRGLPVYESRRDASHPLFFALASEGMVVASPSEASLQAMLDRAAGQGEGLGTNDEMMRQVRQVGSGDAWAVGRDLGRAHRTPTRPASGEAGEGALSQLGDVVEQVALSLQIEADGVEGDVWLAPRAGVAPGDVASLVRGAVAAMKAAPEMDAAKMETLDDVRVRESGEAVRVTFAVANDALPKRP